MSNTALYDFARDVLDALVAGWPVDVTALPERRYVNNGLVAVDCEQVTVAALRVFPTSGDLAIEQVGPDITTLHGCVLGISIYRCVPVVDVSEASGEVEMPDPAAIEAAAEVQLVDAMVPYRVIAQAVRDGVLPDCKAIAFEAWISENTEGGFGGGTTTIRALLV